MSNPIDGFFREITVDAYIESYNKFHSDDYIDPTGTLSDKNKKILKAKYYNYNKFNAFQHAYASASAEYWTGETIIPESLGYGKEAWQVLTDEPSWNLGDTNKDLQNNDLGRAMGDFARKNGISIEDIRDRIFLKTHYGNVYNDSIGMWNNAPDNYRDYMVEPGQGGDWAIGGYRPDTWGYAAARQIRDAYKEKLNNALDAFDVKGKIVDPNAATPSLAEDRLKSDPPGTRYNPPNVSESQLEQFLRETFDNATMTEDQQLEYLREWFKTQQNGNNPQPAAAVKPYNRGVPHVTPNSRAVAATLGRESKVA